MMQEPSQVIISKSDINYNYTTVKMTQSRIEKGLIAIPVSLAKWFPDRNTTIQVYLDDSSILQPKNYSSYESSTHECRIGGMREWLEKNNIKSGDEIVIQLVDKENCIYRIVSEQKFIAKTQVLQRSFDSSESEQRAEESITTLAQWTCFDKKRVVLNEFKRLIHIMPIQNRSYFQRPLSLGREGTPANIRTLLEGIYQGHCQVCDFWFLRRDNKPFFEVHHLDPLKGHHPKNLVVVCGNCHNQFEYANVHLEFNNDGWLTKVYFNERTYSVTQVLLNIRLEEPMKELFI
jgi:hypothetical protein